MKDIAIYGAGGFGKEVACLIKKVNEETLTWKLAGFFDDGKEKGMKVSHYGNVLGGIAELNEWDTPIDIAIAIGSPSIVQKIAQSVVNPLVYFPNVIHPSFNIVDTESFKIGRGNIIQRNCFVSCDVSIGDFNVFNGTVSMGHDDKIGSFNTFMPGVRVSGEVVIPN